MFKQLYLKNNYVGSFSIFEAIISMAVTAVIIGLVFMIFSIITERLYDYKSQNQLVNDLNRFTYCLNKDIFESDQMANAENELKFVGYTGKCVRYQFLEDYIVRDQITLTDTFSIHLQNIKIDTLYGKGGKDTFTRLKLKVLVNKSNLDLGFYKRLYPNELLQSIKE